MSELNEMKSIQLQLGHECPQTVLFRNNTGSAWQGDVTKNSDGSITIRNPRPLRAGLCVGSSDLIGWTKVEITPDMVGKTVAVFTALETKKLKKGNKATEHQLNFIRVVKEAGGKAGVIKTPEQGVEVIRN